MTDDAPTHSDIHAELERARTQFCELCELATPSDHPRLSNGTRWTSRELVFHMLFGYLITRRLRFVIKAVSRVPRRRSRAGSPPLSMRQQGLPHDQLLGLTLRRPRDHTRANDQLVRPHHQRLARIPSTKNPTPRWVVA